VTRNRRLPFPVKTALCPLCRWQCVSWHVGVLAVCRHHGFTLTLIESGAQSLQFGPVQVSRQDTLEHIGE